MEAPLPPPPHGTAVAGVALQRQGQYSMQQPAPAPAPQAAGREQCPRCASHDTKFCYYNNYNTAQPRHFCRACRRYWTLGGSLRNVPIGGSTRKRPRPARPTRAVVVAAASAITGTATISSPFASSPAAAPAPTRASAQSGLLGSLLGSAPLLALGAVPLLEGRLGFDLGLGQPGAGEVGPFGFGAAPLLWPAKILEGDHADAWKAAGVSAAAVWQEFAAAAPVEAGGLHHGAPQLL